MYSTSVECNCDENGSVDNICNKLTGNCYCTNKYTGKQCSQCKNGYFGYPNCTGNKF